MGEGGGGLGGSGEEGGAFALEPRVVNVGG